MGYNNSDIIYSALGKGKHTVKEVIEKYDTNFEIDELSNDNQNISIDIKPSPLQCSHLPPIVLKEKNLDVICLILASFCSDNSFLMSSNPFK